MSELFLDVLYTDLCCKLGVGIRFNSVGLSLEIVRKSSALVGNLSPQQNVLLFPFRVAVEIPLQEKD